MVDKESTDFGMMEVRVEDNREYFCQEVSKLMTDILKMDMENKKMINFNYAELFDKYKRDANSEKIEITTRLGNMDNFERGIEDLMKEYKMGDWKEDKGVFQYDPKYYDEETGVPEEPDESVVLEEGDAENNFDNNEQ